MPKRFVLLCAFLIGSAASVNEFPRTFGRTVFIGDSMTAFWDLKTSFPGQDFINMGVSSESSLEMRNRFDRDVIAFHPRTVVILAGTGDVLRGRKTPDIMANLEFMVGEARAHNTFPVVCTVPPEWPDISGINPGFTIDYNPAINELNAAMRRSVTLGLHCDYQRALSDSSGLPLPGTMKDGVHPSLSGYAIMTSVIEGLRR